MDAGHSWGCGATRSGRSSLYGSLVIHLGLAFWSIYRRRSLRMPAWEAAQLIVGLLIPPLLAIHVIGTRLVHAIYGTDDTYTYELLVIWVFQPASGLQQAAVLAVAWLHGCIGLHFWLRLKSWYAQWVPFAYAGALLVPVIGLLGFVAGGRGVAQAGPGRRLARGRGGADRLPGPGRRRAPLRHRTLVP